MNIRPSFQYSFRFPVLTTLHAVYEQSLTFGLIQESDAEEKKRELKLQLINWNFFFSDVLVSKGECIKNCFNSSMKLKAKK